MAFTKASLPAGGYAMAAFAGGGRWLVFDANNYDRLHVTGDWSTLTTTMKSAIGLTAGLESACYNGASWFFVADSQDGLWRSTDGATGGAWVKTTPDFSGYGHALGGAAKHIHATATGRLIAFGAWGISVSDNAGTSWASVETSVSASTLLRSGISEVGGDIFVWHDRSDVFLRSNDNGDSWGAVFTPTLAGSISAVVKVPAGWAICTALANDVPYVSTDSGSTWAAISGFASDKYFLHGNGTQVALLQESYPDPVLSITDDLVTWDAFPITGLTTDLVYSATPVAIDASTIVLVAAMYGTDTGVFYDDLPAVAPPIVPIALPVRLQLDVSAPIQLGARLQIGETGPAIAAPVRLSLVPDAVLGGLGGAGGWPSAPGGNWMAVVSLAGADISDDLVGQVVVQFADNEARTAEFSFLPSVAIQPMGIVGQRVQIAFAQRDAGGAPLAAQVIFTGVVETPSINMQTGVVYCTCHDQLQEVFANTDRAWIDANLGGRWRAEISGEPDDNWDYLEARRQSVPASVALDAFQQPKVLGWRSGLTAVNVQAADMLDGTLAVDLPSRDDLRTRITVSFEYRFERLRGRGVTAAYSNPISFYISDPSKLWLTSAMVKSAAEGVSGWSIDSLLIESPNPGSYWRGASIEDGVYVIPPEVAPDLALGFSARYHTRWQQTLTQAYTVDLVLPALEAQIGRVSETVSATMDVPFEAQDWATDASVLPALAIPSVGDVVSTWQPAGSDNTARDEVLRTLLDQAWVKLWGASRSGRVRFAIPLRPNMWLDNLVTVQTSRINARGKVVDGEHRMDTETGEAVTTVALAVGLPGDTAASMPSWTLPAVPALSEERPPATYSFDIGTHVGGLLTSPPWDEAGMVGFATNVELPNALAENFYPHQLSIKAPDVIAEDRDPLTQTVAQTVDTTIPTDLLELL